MSDYHDFEDIFLSTVQPAEMTIVVVAQRLMDRLKAIEDQAKHIYAGQDENLHLITRRLDAIEAKVDALVCNSEMEQTKRDILMQLIGKDAIKKDGFIPMEFQEPKP